MKSFKQSYILLILFMLSTLHINCQMIYSDTIKTNDRIRLLNHSDIDEYFFIYNSYMSSAAVVEKLHTRLGMKYQSQIPTCTAGTLTNTLSSTCITPATNSDLIPIFTDNLRCNNAASYINVSVPLEIENSTSSHNYFVQIVVNFHLAHRHILIFQLLFCAIVLKGYAV